MRWRRTFGSRPKLTVFTWASVGLWCFMAPGGRSVGVQLLVVVVVVVAFAAAAFVAAAVGILVAGYKSGSQ
jgi:hypothetical protein